MGLTLLACLQTAENSWQFDIFAFAEATPGHTLSLLYFHLVKQSGVLAAMAYDETKLCNFLQKMDKGYDPSVPYHNRYDRVSNECIALMILPSQDDNFSYVVIKIPGAVAITCLILTICMHFVHPFSPYV